MNIAITGIGVVSAMGVGRDAFWKGCRNARSGIKRIEAFDTRAFRSNVGGVVTGFRPGDYLPPMVFRRMSRISRMAVATSIEALRDSRLDLPAMDRGRVAVIMGTAYGSSAHVDAFYLSLLNEGPRGAKPMLFPETVPNAPAGHIAIFHQIDGPNSTFCQNEISAETAMAYAVNLLSNRVVDAAVVGGAEELTEILYGCYDAVGALNRLRVHEGEPIQPVPGGGLILGEGSATLILERLDSARDRGARIYGTLNSVAFTGGSCAMGHYEPSGEPMCAAMQAAVDQAGLQPSDIDHISLSANFSRELDGIEQEQVRRLFPTERRRMSRTPLKYLTGDFGAAGVTRAAAVLLSLYHQEPLPSLAVHDLPTGRQPVLVWERPDRGGIQHALMTSTSFGGGSCSMVFARCSPGILNR